ncbi:hypothetical protein BBO99_00004758 [Phytophthora kernoviae]|uniref:Uncharacterized protein n=2 Tax=Phytophthora kernoviae TaxID=325452 RepID=A0A3R7GLA2_9STRA|nr:hypothetical protein G195_005424 [Phytophthora kernoviae 00238/432]KAG2525000.1 hypothetical protein JM16_004420 [Phytophthora kernoviae]KAG2526770.1 hypothetical protein JM18_004211 [Phytophthora kernoviae]RLN14417.1 hypothetical protein BBI17_004781 [Phytophthora kernoviae]RLN80111.1 hypothetical protein BBO99_00004758 [Phytophthora kernoviae]
MAISDQVCNQLFQPATAQSSTAKRQAIRIPTTRGGSPSGGLVASPAGSARGLWTPEEHLRFLEALDKFPKGPWKCIAEYVGTKTPRQAMTHGQKYRQKIARRRRGLKKIVRDLQFAAMSESDLGTSDDATARLSIESNPMGLSDEDFTTFLASVELAEELDPKSASPLDDSPLVVPTTTAAFDDLPSFSLDSPEPRRMPPSMENIDSLPITTAQQDTSNLGIPRSNMCSMELPPATRNEVDPCTLTLAISVRDMR